MMMAFSLSLLTPIIIASIYQEQTHGTFLFSFAITFSLGMLMWLPFSRINADLRIRDGFLITVMFWIELCLVGALPFILVDTVHLSITDAVFESVSGLTTTGATVITGLELLPKSILYYRQQLHWLGGIGIVVIAVAIMPMLGVGGMQLYRAESPGPVKDNKLTPRITETAKALFAVYLFLTIICSIAYWLAGMNLFDAITHAFSTIATGGFANYDASMGYFNDNVIYIICILYIKLEFKKHKTTISPSNPDNATSLVQSGFFRFSRNPIYFSLLNIIFWFSIYLGSFFGLIVTPLFVIYMNQFQIIPEEKAMLKLFSDKYKSYCLQVRRWI